jgi:hypothetical protein
MLSPLTQRRASRISQSRMFLPLQHIAGRCSREWFNLSLTCSRRARAMEREKAGVANPTAQDLLSTSLIFKMLVLFA